MKWFSGPVPSADQGCTFTASSLDAVLPAEYCFLFVVFCSFKKINISNSSTLYTAKVGGDRMNPEIGILPLYCVNGLLGGRMSG